jgi:hypothetical protein
MIINNYYSVIRSRKMRWRGGGDVARSEEKGNAHRVLVGKTEGKNHWEGLSVNAGIILQQK